MYCLVDKKGYWYLWNETDGKRSSCEIGTCLFTYLKSLPCTVKQCLHVLWFLCGQNRNQYIAALVHYTVLNLPHIEVIDQKFLESSKHAKKNISIYVPHMWDTIITMARKQDPYSVIPLQYHSIVDLNKLANTNHRNFTSDKKENKLNWLNLKWTRFWKVDPKNMYLKSDFMTNNAFCIIQLNIYTTGRPNAAVYLSICQ
jgi:hypothetical protein